MKNILTILLLTATSLTLYAQKFQQEFGNPRKAFVETVATPNHPDSYYHRGQSATLRVVAREGGVPLEGVTLRYKVGPEMWLPEQWDSTRFVGGEALVPMGTMTKPGFLACQYEFGTSDGKTVKDLVKLAYDPEQIRTLTPLPQDFTRFWQQALKEACKYPFEPEYRDIPDATNDACLQTEDRRHRARRERLRQNRIYRAAASD